MSASIFCTDSEAPVLTDLGVARYNWWAGESGWDKDTTWGYTRAAVVWAACCAGTAEQDSSRTGRGSEWQLLCVLCTN